MKNVMMIILAVVLTGCKIEQKPVLYWYKPGATDNDICRDYSSTLPPDESRLIAFGYKQCYEYQLPEGTKTFQDTYHHLNYAYDANAYEAQRENYIKNHPERPQYILDAIRGKQIAKGMTTEEVLVSWNNFNPAAIKKYRTSEGFEAYLIGSYTLFFQDNYLTKWVVRG